MVIRKTFKFEAAHVLPHHPGKCARLHGHSYRFDVAVRGALQTTGPATGMVVDFDALSAIVRPNVVERLDHSSLNDLLPNPTAEEIALWIWHELEPHIAGLDEIVVWKRRRPAPSCEATMLALAETFYSVQGEGTWTGTPAVFVRLAGCNLNCRFCDTDYSLKEYASVENVVARVRELGGACPTVILTGGEPLAQRESSTLIDALRHDGRRVHIESNGSIAADLPDDVWLTVSPKERLDPRMAARANEVKLIVDGRVPLEWLDSFAGRDVPTFLQPEGNKAANIALALEAAKALPERVRLGLQTHKFIGVR